jgi:hypothetical protein
MRGDSTLGIQRISCPAGLSCPLNFFDSDQGAPRGLPRRFGEGGADVSYWLFGN